MTRLGPPAECLGRIGVALWVGGILALGLFAPIVFDTIPEDRALAGSILERIFALFRWVELSCAGVVLLSALALLSRPLSRRDTMRVGISILMASLVSVNAFLLAPRLERLRPQIRTFHVPPERDRNDWRHLFDEFHSYSERCSKVNFVLGIILLSIWDRRREPHT